MPSPGSTNRAAVRGVRRPQRGFFGTWLPVIVLALASGCALYKLSVQWTELIAAQKERRAAQELLEGTEGSVAASKDTIKSLKEELSGLAVQNEHKQQEIQVTLSEVQQFQSRCDARRADLKETHDREVQDATWEAKNRAMIKLQDKQADDNRHHQARVDHLVLVHERYDKLTREMHGVERAVAEIEMERVLFRMLGNTSSPYVKAFYDRLKRGNFHDSYLMNLQTLYSAQALSQKMSGLWYVDSDNERASLGSVPAELPDHLPKVDPLGMQYPRGGVWHSCAVVGTSGALLQYKMGSEIDAHAAVFRINSSPVKGFEEHVGRRTTLRIVQDAAHAESREQPSKQMVLQQISTKVTLTEFIEYKSQPKSMNLYYMSPELELHAARYLKRPITWGFFAAVLATQKCRKIVLYGFTSHHRGHVQYRYWDKEQPKMLIRSSVGSAYDIELNEMGLLSELVERSNGTTSMALPCMSTYECMTSCRDCNELPLSDGGVCECESPLPVPAPGFCSDKGTPANCFRKCPKGVDQCAGGGSQLPCDKLGVSIDQPVVGPRC